MIIITVIMSCVGALLFIVSVLRIIKIGQQKILDSEFQAYFLLIGLLGLIFSIVKIFQGVVSTSLTAQFDELSEFIIFVLIINIVNLVIYNIIFKKPGGIKTNIKARTNIFVLILFLQFVFIGSFWSIFYFYKQAESVTLQQTKQLLNAVATSRASHIATLVDDYKSVVVAYASNLTIIDCLQDIAKGDKDCDKENLGLAISEGMSQNPVVILAIVIDTNGIVIGSSNDSLLGQDWSNKDEFLNHSQGGYFSSFLPGDSSLGYLQNYLVLSVPITIDGKFLGVLSVHTVPDGFYSVLADRTNMGDTGESYIVSNSKKLLTPQRFDDTTLINIDTPNTEACVYDSEKYIEETVSSLAIKPHDNELLEFTNKFGRKILGTRSLVQSKIDGTGWCVLTEMSKNEAFALLQMQLLKATILILVVLLMMILVFMYTFDFFFKGLWKNEKNN